MGTSARRTIGIPHWLLRLLFTGTLREKPCGHRDQIRVLQPSANVCAECVASGDTWPALRMCMICGYVGCCDQSKNKHAREHFEQTRHPLMRSIAPGEDWMWCYVDKALLSVPPASHTSTNSPSASR
ncbi:MAG: UBP-type zinc finger domain-containing protein [Chloroflexota bacterium]